MRSQWTWLPSPTGTPSASTSTTPPSESPSLAAALTSRIIASAAAGSKQRTGDSSTCARSPKVGRAAVARAAPICTTWESTRTPSSASSSLATAPAATRAAVSRALARSSTSRASVNPYFCIPARSACPGRTWVSGAAVAPGAGDISACHLSLRNHSVLRISMATGEPIVRP